MKSGHEIDDIRVSKKCTENRSLRFIVLNNTSLVPILAGIIITNGVAWSIEFKYNGGYFETGKKKFHFVLLIFLERVKRTSADPKLDRPQLQHWLLFLEHNKSQKAQMLLQAYLYLWALTAFMIQLSTPPHSFSFRVMQAPVLVGFRSCGLQLF